MNEPEPLHFSRLGTKLFMVGAGAVALTSVLMAASNEVPGRGGLASHNTEITDAAPQLRETLYNITTMAGLVGAAAAGVTLAIRRPEDEEQTTDASVEALPGEA
jgi:hypothetical protein